MILWLAQLALPFAVAADPGSSPVVVKNQGFLPFAGAPIHYRSSASLSDQVSILNRQLLAGDARLDWEPRNGYLRSVLQRLGIPESSQTLVASKTSLQLQHISPRTPRALYFNDNVYVGQVPGAKSLELISFDANQGAIFYVLSEEKVERPRFERSQLDCIQCHIHAATRGVPGVMVRSMRTTPEGYPKGGSPVYTMGHETPIEQRWGGWFVTAAAGNAGHMGASPPATGGFKAAYLHEHSDIVAHLVLAHQTQMHNLITETNYRFRLGQGFEAAAEATLRYLLFSNEAPLGLGPVSGSTSFSQDFTQPGPRDRKGRSLRDFDLEKRIFKYPCSYLIYTDAFDAIPGAARQYLLRRLFEVLSGHDQSPDSAALTAEERRNILEILLDTKPGFQEEWKRFSQEPQNQKGSN